MKTVAIPVLEGHSTLAVFPNSHKDSIHEVIHAQYSLRLIYVHNFRT